MSQSRRSSQCMLLYAGEPGPCRVAGSTCSRNQKKKGMNLGSCFVELFALLPSRDAVTAHRASIGMAALPASAETEHLLFVVRSGRTERVG